MADIKRSKSTRSQLLAKLKEISNELTASNEREGSRIGRLAVEAGLADLELTDRELLAGFAKLKDLALAGEFGAGSANPLPVRRPAPAAAAQAAAGQKSAA